VSDLQDLTNDELDKVFSVEVMQDPQPLKGLAMSSNWVIPMYSVSYDQVQKGINKLDVKQFKLYDRSLVMMATAEIVEEQTPMDVIKSMMEDVHGIVDYSAMRTGQSSARNKAIACIVAVRGENDAN
jgi:hypothetical protein